ncbi:NAD(P)H-binding protein [Leifsonia poae]|uniref:NAD(P)H-binding protein n=1 Tax=Leifsonia poae TaxID=110933 RepID=UPI003D6989AB
MTILLTGATGFIGSSVLPRLLDEGHSVIALVRDAEKAAAVEAVGATALIGDATDAALVERAARESDGVIHLASAKDVDAVLVPAVLAGLAGTGKPFVHTGGIWTYGSNDDIAEDSPSLRRLSPPGAVPPRRWCARPRACAARSSSRRSCTDTARVSRT